MNLFGALDPQGAVVRGVALNLVGWLDTLLSQYLKFALLAKYDFDTDNMSQTPDVYFFAEIESTEPLLLIAC